MRPVTIMSRSSMMRHLLVEVLLIETIRIHVGTVQRIPFAPSCTSEQRQHGRPVWRFATSTQSPGGYDALSTNLVMQLHDDIETKIIQDRARETLRYDALLQVMIGSLVCICISFSAAFATFDSCKAIPMPRRVWHMLLWKRFAIKRW